MFTLLFNKTFYCFSLKKKKKKKKDFGGHYNFIIYKGGLRAIKLHVASPHKKEKKKKRKVSMDTQIELTC